MTRIQRSKLFVGGIIAIVLVFIAVNFYYLGPIKGLASILAVQLLIIWHNRKQKENLKNFNIARKLHKQGRYNEAITMFLTYLKEVKARPDQGKTTLLNFGVYTNSSIAMSYNNIGAACIEMGYYQKAIESLERAIEVDGEYAIPYYNLAIVATIRGNDELFNRYMSKISALGYKVTLDEIANKIESLPEEVLDENIE